MGVFDLCSQSGFGIDNTVSSTSVSARSCFIDCDTSKVMSFFWIFYLKALCKITSYWFLMEMCQNILRVKILPSYCTLYIFCMVNKIYFIFQDFHFQGGCEYLLTRNQGNCAQQIVYF